MVQKNVAKKNKCYEVKLVSLNGERNSKPKKVYCYISPKVYIYITYRYKFERNILYSKNLQNFPLCIICISLLCSDEINVRNNLVFPSENAQHLCHS